MTKMRIAIRNIPDITIDTGDNYICLSDISSSICLYIGGQLFTLNVIDNEMLEVSIGRDLLMRYKVSEPSKYKISDKD